MKRAPCPPRALDQATAELSSAIGALAFSGAALYGLAMGIRAANNMDEHDARLAEIANTSSLQVAKVDAPAVAAVTPVASSEQVVDELEIQRRAEEAKAWISGWRERSATLIVAKAAEEEAAAAAIAARKASEERNRIEAAHAERLAREQAEAAERKAKEAEERALAAAKAVAAKEAEMATLKANAEAQVAARAQEARRWINSWQEKTDALSSSADPAMAAAVIKKMTEDAPVGLQTGSSSPPTPVSSPSTPEPAVVGSASSPSAQSDATQKVSQATRRVSITAEYETKISSLLSSYEATKQREREAALRQPKQIVEVSAEELAKATRKTNPVVVFFLKIVAMIQACFSYLKSLLFGSSSSTGSGSPASA